jgi:hypothetical protein
VKKHLGNALTTVAMLAGLALLGFLALSWWQSRLPGNYDVMSYGAIDDGGAQPVAHDHFSVAGLTGPKGKPDYRLTLTAEKTPIRLASGQKVNAWTFNGIAPGPEIRVRQGDLVQVTLANKDIGDGVTIHWHGLDVPNAEDGVAGVTQNAVEQGGRYVYRFRPEQVGTFWYHTHQDASQGVKQGLYGALIVETTKKPRGLDLALPVHTFSGRTAIGTHDDVWRRAVPTGTPVRLRLINTDNATARFKLAGMRPAVVAIDGATIAPVRVPPGEPIEIGGGGRYDVAFRMPDGVASMEVVNSNAALVLSPDGSGEPAATPSGRVFDPATRTSGFTGYAGLEFDRTFDLKISKKLGFPERQALSASADVRGGQGRPRPHQPGQRLLVGASDAPPRPPLHRSHAQREDRDPVVDRHAADGAEPAVFGRVPSRQPRALDAPLPQPQARCRRPHDARHVRGRDDALPGRQVSAQRS